ncbi:MAG TPA: hypothetical protein VGF80_03745 [Galbitalea sp.]|jgi:acyl-CoA reductase-like NAD-dependent aldehyde dehydrogenase
MLTNSETRLDAELESVAATMKPSTPFSEQTPAERSAQLLAMAEDDDDNPNPLAATASSEQAARVAELSTLHAQGLISNAELAFGQGHLGAR